VGNGLDDSDESVVHEFTVDLRPAEAKAASIRLSAEAVARLAMISSKQRAELRSDRSGGNSSAKITGPAEAASYGPKTGLVLHKPVSKHGSEVADRSVMTFVRKFSDLD
jgi:hypothetical protein